MSSTKPKRALPRAVSAWLAAVNLLMAATVLFVAVKIDHVIAYVASAPLILTFLVTAGTYAWLTVTSRNRWRGSRGSR